MIRILVLFLHAHALWPNAPTGKLLDACTAAVHAEGGGIEAETLVAIAHHESDLEPAAVSWRVGGRTTSQLLTRPKLVVPSRIVFGYLQAMGTRSVAEREIARDGGMSAGAAELREWMGTCRGDLACALRGHAGGTRCALDVDACSPAARAFAELFIAHTRRLKAPVRRPTT